MAVKNVYINLGDEIAVHVVLDTEVKPSKLSYESQPYRHQHPPLRVKINEAEGIGMVTQMYSTGQYYTLHNNTARPVPISLYGEDKASGFKFKF